MRNDANILNINTVEEMMDIVKKYGVEKPYAVNDNEKVIDWELLSKDYDGIHIPSNIVHALRFARYDLGCDFDLYSWDVGSWVIFNYDIIDESTLEYKEFDLSDEE